jgi:pyruvate/2-oxoglutarate dehydrogenase complex dihydrolipoamide acyltransferase (E2) component
MMDLILPNAFWDGAQDGVEALLDKWLIAKGVPVVKGQVLASVVLVKASLENGTIEEIFVNDGESFASGKVLASFKTA